MTTRISSAPLLVVTLGSALVACEPAFAQDAFYKGRTVTIVVGFSAGGGYDLYARLVARHLGRHVPGNPSFIVQNMPGAATLTAVRYLDASAPKDGTVITAFDPGLVLETIAKPDLHKVTFSNYRWVGALLRDVRVCYASQRSGVKNWAELMARKEFVIGNTARGSTYINGAVLWKVLHAPVRQVSGYPGSNELRMALERGEIEGNCGSWTALPQDWILKQHVNTFVRYSPKRPVDMPASVPFANDLASTEQQKVLLDVLNGSGELGRPYIVARQVPEERAQILRTGFAAMVKDAAFLADAEKQRMLLDPVSGEEAEKVIARIYGAPADLKARVKEFFD